MQDPKQQQQENRKPQYLKPEVRKFYHALGTFNANIISQLIKNPERIKELTDSIIEHPGHAQECGPHAVWDDWQHVCIRLDAENEL